MSILTLGSKKEEKKNFQSQKKRRKISNQRKKGSKEIPNQRVGESEKKRKKIPNQRMGESKKGRKESSRSRIERKQKKCAERSLDQTISEQYRIVTKYTKRRKGNHNLKWYSPFDRQPKSCASVTCSPRVKQKQKRKKPKIIIKSRKTHQKNPVPREVLLIHDHACNF